MRRSSRNNNKKNKIIIAASLIFIVIVAVVLFFLFKENAKDLDASFIDEEESSVIESTQDHSNETVTKSTSSTKASESNPSVNETKGKFYNWNNSCKEELIVVNKLNPISQDKQFDLVLYDGKYINRVAYEPLVNMRRAAANDGMNLWLSSVYRPIDEQITLFNREIQEYKARGLSSADAEIQAAKSVAPPYTSEHHTGLAIDFNGVKENFTSEKEYKWLVDNAANYGFVLRYTDAKKPITDINDEPWHFRYVGVEAAREMKAKGLCLEEYITSQM